MTTFPCLHKIWSARSYKPAVSQILLQYIKIPCDKLKNIVAYCENSVLEIEIVNYRYVEKILCKKIEIKF